MKFTKMHGLGNDFILIEHNPGFSDNYSRLAAALCDRRLGIGGDGLVIVRSSEQAEIRMQILNSDGSEPEMCGNAIRCFAKYVYERGLVRQETFGVETLAGVMVPALHVRNGVVETVRVNMGAPNLERSAIPMIGSGGPAVNETLAVADRSLQITSLLMGVPHTQVFVEDVRAIDFDILGPAIETHETFPRKTNVNFVQVIGRDEIRVRTWERGAGPTLACGTGSCASVVSGVLAGRTERRAIVHLQVGDLEIEWDPSGDVFMSGTATEVFTGEIERI